MMKTPRALEILSILAISIMGIPPVFAEDSLGLMIIAHGSPSSKWNNPVLDLEKNVKAILDQRDTNPFDEVRVALMEFSKPSINDVVEYMERKSVTRIFAVPIFIAPSGHSERDIPTILGLKYDAGMIGELVEERIELVETSINITIGPTLYQSDILKAILLDTVKDLSKDPDAEGLVLLAHGDHDFHSTWEVMCREIGTYICMNTGIKTFDYGFVEVGQSFIMDGLPVILKMAEKTQRVIVVGIYLSMGLENMAQNSVLSIGRMKIDSASQLSDKSVIFSDRGLLPDKRISWWIAQTACDWHDSYIRIRGRSNNSDDLQMKLPKSSDPPKP